MSLFIPGTQNMRPRCVREVVVARRTSAWQVERYPVTCCFEAAKQKIISECQIRTVWGTVQRFPAKFLQQVLGRPCLVQLDIIFEVNQTIAKKTESFSREYLSQAFQRGTDLVGVNCVSMLQEVHQEQISESEKTAVSTLPADCVTLNFFVSEPGCVQSIVYHLLDGVEWRVHSHHQ